MVAGDVESARVAYRRAHITACRVSRDCFDKSEDGRPRSSTSWMSKYELKCGCVQVSGQDFVPTAELAMVADNPPASREALIQYFQGRTEILKQIER